jgi:glycosyltransferase involved in cell wall biosynthesis
MPVPDGIEASYPRFVEWIRNQNRWHWAVAPLLDSQFNRSKSALKILEDAALGLPSICSEGPVYSGAVRHEETALLVTNDLESWRHALERAATDAALWMRLRERSQVLASENTISARAEIIKSAWRNVIRGGAANVAAAKGRSVDRRQHSYS